VATEIIQQQLTHLGVIVHHQNSNLLGHCGLLA